MAKILADGRVQVEKGDTLWGIAEQVFGNGSRWRELGYSGDPTKLQIGTILVPSQTTATPTSTAGAISATPAQRETAQQQATAAQQQQMASWQSQSSRRDRIIAFVEQKRAERHGATWPEHEAAQALKEVLGSEPPSSGEVRYLAYGEFPPEFREPAAPNVDDFLKTIIDAQQKQMDKLAEESEAFETANPFNLDEIQKETADEVSELYDPYYEQELSSYLEGVELQRKQSKFSEKQLLDELTARRKYTTAETERTLQEAIRKSEQGFVGRGLFESGERLRETGRLRGESQIGLAEYLRQSQAREKETIKTGEFEEKRRTLEQKREVGAGTAEEILRQFREQATLGGRLGAERTTQLLTETQRGIQRKALERELLRRQALGPPYSEDLSIYGLLSV